VARIGIADVRAFGLTGEDREQFLRSSAILHKATSSPGSLLSRPRHVAFGSIRYRLGGVN
jgi:hypothetical protein